jgi:DeoR/GlpR family transcriptional regulator of sugar metabolism
MTGKQAKRHTEILEIITKQTRIEVACLAEKVAVSTVTIRKDLDMLEDKGLIRHERGFVLPGSSDDINNRLTYHYDIKRKIAQTAAELVKDGETVMVESGSCCAILAEELTVHKRDVTIITNSAFIAAYIRRNPQAKIILLGGDYQNEAQVMVGPITRKDAEGFSVEKLFIGTDGFTEKTGFTGNNHLRAETVRDMAKQAAQVIILTESEKFTRQGVVPLVPTKDISAVITDTSIPAETEVYLQEQHVTVYKVPLSGFC